MDHILSNTLGIDPATNRLDQTVSQLNLTEMQMFLMVLNSPLHEADANPGLARLMAITPPWVNQNT